MGYVKKVALRPNIESTNGSESITFITAESILRLEDINFATSYFNPITGLFDDQKSTLYFESGESLLINQTMAVTIAELSAL
jgi:hypothetical protein|tara:strand:+ start:873 stop:1118 length:246 start_codon:yes stop_codon:yes gene_type:complete